MSVGKNLELHRGNFFGSVLTKGIGGFLLSRVYCDREVRLPWHSHSEPALSFVMAGRFSEHLRSGRLQCLPGMMILRPAGQRHAQEFKAATTCLNVSFDDRWRERINAQQIGSSLVLATSTARAIGAKIAHEFCRADSLSATVLEGLLLEFAGELERGRNGEPVVPWLERAYEIVNARFASPLSLRLLAQEVAVHPAHLARSFRDQYGQTVGEMIRLLRVEQVKTRILEGASLSAAAAETGFADQSHMTRTFATLTGMTPSAFRRGFGVQQPRGA